LHKIDGLKTLFHIQADDSDQQDQVLLIEVGPDYCVYAIANSSRNALNQIRYINYDEFKSEEAIAQIINEVQKINIRRTIICSASPQSILVPQKRFNGEYGLLDVTYDQPAQQYFHDSIAEWQLINTYSMPSTIFNLLSTLPSPKYYHVYTPSLKIYNGFTGASQVSVHFNTQTFRVLVKKEGNIHLAQTYSYKTPLDVVYYLLKIFSEFGLDQKETYLILSGLVQEDSALYKELYSYFQNLHFAHAPQIALPANDHPHHFFLSIYNLAACES